MTDLILYLYLIDIFSNLTSALNSALVFLLMVLGLVVIFVVAHATDGDFGVMKSLLRKVFVPVFLLFCGVGLLKVTIPSKQTMYIALGLHTANQVLKQPQMVQVGNQAMRILQDKLDEYEKELTQEKEK